MQGLAKQSVIVMNNLPSQHQIGDRVDFFLNNHSGKIDATVIAVHFYLNKVKYDLEIPLTVDERDPGTTRIYNVSSNFVLRPLTEEEKANF